MLARLLPAAALLLLAIACGGGSTPTSPSASPSVAPLATNPTPPPPAFAGTVTDAISGAPVLDFTATLNGGRLLVSAPGYVTRDTRAGASTVDLIPEAGFDLDFYRQFARGGMDGPPQALRVLRESPSIYMEVEGAKGLSAQMAAQLQVMAQRLIPELTGGKLQLARWETGPTARSRENGWIMIERRDEENSVCGRALIGASAGQIWLDGNRRCNLAAVFAHELGHALGFSHVDREGSLMFPRDRAFNIADAPTERERRHAAIAYKRAPGNRDIDVDP